jgi:hypothetical protein
MSGVIKSGDMNGYSQLKICSFKNILLLGIQDYLERKLKHCEC